MAGMRRGYADGPFGQIHYQDGGRGRPVVLLHQAIMSSEQFASVFPALSGHGLRPIGIDMPGFGLSDAPAAPPGIADYATAVLPVLDALGIERAAIVGHHTGSLVATEVALTAPERIAAVVIAGPVIVSEDERRAIVDGLIEQEKRFRAQPGGRHFVEIAEIRERLAEGSIGPERISDYVVQAMQAYAMGAYWYGHAAAFAYDHEGALSRLVQPTLLLTNSGDMTHPAALAARALRPDFGFTELPGGGIDICDQAPQAWADAIARFLAEHP